MPTLGDCLKFAPDGKLEKLCLAGSPNLLHEWDQEIDLGGKKFRPAGWDECFPTIDPYQASPVMGEIIGLLPETHWFPEHVDQTFRSPRFEARRCFRLETPSKLEMSFQVTNRHEMSLEFLWASHALYSVGSLQKMHLANGAEFTDFYNNGTEQKIFISNLGPVELFYFEFQVLLTTDQPWWGIWLNRGGWPAGSHPPLCCLGVEATNTPGEHPDGQQLAPNATFSGEVKLELLS